MSVEPIAEAEPCEAMVTVPWEPVGAVAVEPDGAGAVEPDGAGAVDDADAGADNVVAETCVTGELSSDGETSS